MLATEQVVMQNNKGFRYKSLISKRFNVVGMIEAVPSVWSQKINDTSGYFGGPEGIPYMTSVIVPEHAYW